MRKLVLILDDEGILARSVARLLCREFDVDIFLEGDEAMRAIQTKEYHCIISDVRMSGMSGQEFFRNVKEFRPELVGRFVFHTASIDDDLPVEVPALLKPVAAETLLTVVRSLAAA